MSEGFQAVQVSERVYWVGAIDWNIRDFHGYSTSRGTSYNAYLVLAEKVTLIDTVKAPFGAEMMQRIASVIDPSRIEYIISNHSEMDHTGFLPQAIKAIAPKKVFASANGVKALKAHFGSALDAATAELVAVKDGETLSLGDCELAFYATPMLHWPDSMFTWYGREGVLFTNDAFGMHLASSERFTDQVPWDVIEQETAKYYANILMPFSKIIVKLSERLGQLHLPLKLIATDHGPIWRQGIERILQMYAAWAGGQKSGRKVVVVYDTMWHSTERMAEALAEGLSAGGASPRMMPLSGSHRSDVATELLTARGLLVGSPTLNNNMLPTVADVLTYLRGLKPAGLVAGAFGSYGWGGEAVKQVHDILAEMKLDMVGEPLKVTYVPDEQALAQCVAFGRLVAAKL